MDPGIILVLTSLLFVTVVQSQQNQLPSDSKMQCAITAAASLSTSPCFSKVITDLNSLVVNTKTPADFYETSTSVIQHLCSAGPCTDTTWRNTAANLMETCTQGGESESNNSRAEIQTVGRNSFLFAKDLVCISDNQQPCTLEFIAMAKKYHLVSMSSVEAGTGMEISVVRFLRALGISERVVIPAITGPAVALVPNAELCTKCTQVFLSQLASFAFRDVGKDQQGAIRSGIDKAADFVDLKCGSGFVRRDASIVLGTPAPARSVDQIVPLLKASADGRLLTNMYLAVGFVGLVFMAYI